ncbi:MAG: hypothetical protein KGH64_00545 [Candidatus Micrarchaeota archaeon]|nr:hypothetical protein [Candidatus Micrarchaeota archaeon]MDE1859585.1 hypothetical protein [Candidatus Micrarchaeota archaeon]
MDEIEALKAYNNIYLEIMMRYKAYIEEKEVLYIADLPKLVTPSDESVIMLAREIQNSFPLYTYDENFPDAARYAYQYMKGRIADISLPIQIWLTPSQTIKYGAGDIFDKAVALCSVLIALGNVSSRIVAIVRDSERDFIVYSEFKDHIIGVNIEKGVKEYRDLDSLLKEMGVKASDETTVYEFNDKMYRDII